TRGGHLPGSRRLLECAACGDTFRGRRPRGRRMGRTLRRHENGVAAPWTSLAAGAPRRLYRSHYRFTRRAGRYCRGYLVPRAVNISVVDWHKLLIAGRAGTILPTSGGARRKAWP